jgi:hypothetical protein
MSAADTGSLIDFAMPSSGDAGITAPVSTPSADVETPDTGADYTPRSTENSDSSEGQQVEGQRQQLAGQGEQKAPTGDLKDGAIRNLLKNIKETDPSPENQAAVKQLHQAFERSREYQKAFPTVSAARDAARILSTHGGPEGAAELLSSIQESDNLLYAGDPKLLDNIVEDLRSSGNLEALGKLGPAFLDKLRTVDQAAYFKTMAPHFLQSLQEVNLLGGKDGGAIDGLINAFNAGDKKAMADILNGIVNWYQGLRKTAGQLAGKPGSEGEAAWQTEKRQFEESKVQAAKEEIVGGAQKFNRQTLGTSLKPFLAMPFFKGMPRETLTHLADTIQNNLRVDLSKDKTYQAQVSALMKMKNPDKAKILEYHSAKVQSISDRIVRETIQKIYPGYNRGGSAAGRVAAKANQARTQHTGKLTTVTDVPSKPKDLIRDDRVKQLTGTDWQTLEVSGRGVLQTANGPRIVRWRKN